MEKVQSLKISEDEVVIPSSHSYLDEEFYSKAEQANTSKVNIPVRLRAIDVRWIFNYPEGQEFLIKLSQI